MPTKEEIPKSLKPDIDIDADVDPDADLDEDDGWDEDDAPAKTKDAEEDDDGWDEEEVSAPGPVDEDDEDDEDEEDEEDEEWDEDDKAADVDEEEPEEDDSESDANDEGADEGTEEEPDDGWEEEGGPEVRSTPQGVYVTEDEGDEEGDEEGDDDVIEEEEEDEPTAPQSMLSLIVESQLSMESVAAAEAEEAKAAEDAILAQITSVKDSVAAVQAQIRDAGVKSGFLAFALDIPVKKKRSIRTFVILSEAVTAVTGVAIGAVRADTIHPFDLDNEVDARRVLSLLSFLQGETEAEDFASMDDDVGWVSLDDKWVSTATLTLPGEHKDTVPLSLVQKADIGNLTQLTRVPELAELPEDADPEEETPVKEVPHVGVIREIKSTLDKYREIREQSWNQNDESERKINSAALLDIRDLVNIIED